MAPHGREARRRLWMALRGRDLVEAVPPPLGWLRAGEAGIELKVEDAREGVSEGARVGELEGNIEDDSRDGGSEGISEPECDAGRESGGGEARYGLAPLPAAAGRDRGPEREGEA